MFDLTSSTVPGPNGGISASGITVRQATPSSSPIVFVADQGNDRVERFVLDPVTLAPAGPPQLSAPALGLSFPQGIAIHPDGTRLYVADDDNHRVVVLDPDSLAMISQVGSLGTGPGQFQNPYDVAVDARPPFQLYVADNLNNRVDVFDAATLASVGTFGGFGRTPGLFSIVRAVGAIADDPRGGVDVADTANNRIQALDATGEVLGAWGIAGRGAGYLTRPAGAAFDAAGGIAVADTFDHRISRWDADGTWTGLFGKVSTFNGFATAGAATGQFSRPEGVAFDAAGTAWVADTGNDRVVAVVPATGEVASTSGAGVFSGPRGIARGTAGGVVVADTGHGAIAAVAPGGAVSVLRSGLSHPAAVAAGGPGPTVYAADDTHVLEVAGGAQVAPPPGSASWDHPAGLAVAADGTLYVSERRPATANGARVVRGTPGPGGFTWDTIASEGAGPAQVIEPAGLALSDDGGTLLVADSGNDRVLRFDAPGASPPVTHAVRVSVTGITRGTVTSAPAGHRVPHRLRPALRRRPAGHPHGRARRGQRLRRVDRRVRVLRERGDLHADRHRPARGGRGVHGAAGRGAAVTRTCAVAGSSPAGRAAVAAGPREDPRPARRRAVRHARPARRGHRARRDCGRADRADVPGQGEGDAIQRPDHRHAHRDPQAPARRAARHGHGDRRARLCGQLARSARDGAPARRSAAIAAAAHDDAAAGRPADRRRDDQPAGARRRAHPPRVRSGRRVHRRGVVDGPDRRRCLEARTAGVGPRGDGWPAVHPVHGIPACGPARRAARQTGFPRLTDL